MTDPRTPTIEQADMLRLPRVARWTIGFVAIGCLCAGGVAVFRVHNDVGTLALLIVGALLLTTAGVGIVPIRVKVGGHEVAYVAQEMSYAERTRQIVAEAISRPETALENRRTISDLIVGFNEQFMRQVGVVPESGRELATLAYTTSILAALRRAIPEAQVVEPPAGSVISDFVLLADGKEIHVACALRVTTTSGPMPREVVGQLISHAADVRRLLAVTNRPPETKMYDPAVISSAGKSMHFVPRTLPDNLKIVKWTSPEDDRDITSAVKALAPV